MTPKEYGASEAKRILGDVEPYFAELEKRCVEEMIRTCSWDEESDRKRRCLADKIQAMRDLKAQLDSLIRVAAPNVRGQGHV